MIFSTDSPLYAIAAIVTIASITPGPNNFLVMRAALRSGIAGAVPSIAGIVVGSIGLLVICLCGIGTLITSAPKLRMLIVVAGGTYLGFLGVKMITSRAERGESPGEPVPQSAPRRLLSSATFQVLNPKSWILVLSAIASAAANADTRHVFFEVGALLLAIPTICLFIWAVLGLSLTRWLSSGRSRRWFDRVMGTSLLLSSLTLLSSA